MVIAFVGYDDGDHPRGGPAYWLRACGFSPS
jgi:hypothetical protein